jgi:hypothetical protein
MLEALGKENVPFCMITENYWVSVRAADLGFIFTDIWLLLIRLFYS